MSKSPLQRIRHDNLVVRELGTVAYRNLFQSIFRMPIKDIERLKGQDDCPSLIAYICNCILAGTKNSDYATLDKMLDRVIGKAKSDEDITHIYGMSDEELETEVKKIMHEKGLLNDKEEK